MGEEWAHLGSPGFPEPPLSSHPGNALYPQRCSPPLIWISRDSAESPNSQLRTSALTLPALSKPHPYEPQPAGEERRPQARGHLSAPWPRRGPGRVRGARFRVVGGAVEATGRGRAGQAPEPGEEGWRGQGYLWDSLQPGRVPRLQPGRRCNSRRDREVASGWLVVRKAPLSPPPGQQGAGETSGPRPWGSGSCARAAQAPGGPAVWAGLAAAPTSAPTLVRLCGSIRGPGVAGAGWDSRESA